MVSQEQIATLIEMEKMTINSELDAALNGGRLGLEWIGSPYKGKIEDCVKALKQHMPSPHNFREIVHQEAVRRIQQRHKTA